MTKPELLEKLSAIQIVAMDVDGTFTDGTLFYDPEGNVFICPILDMKLGNIRENPFDKVWSSPDAHKARAFAPSCPRRCWMACTATPFIKAHFFKVLRWIISKKLASHLRRPVAML